MPFPGSTTTFTIKRKSVTVINGNPTPGLAVIASGISILLNDLQGIIAEDQGGPQFSGQYKAATYLDSPIFIGDILMDENELESNGQNVQYQVQGKTLGAISMHLHLERTFLKI